MGVIQKQSIKGTAYSYIGVLLGFITSGLLFPRILSTEEIGLLRILVSYSIILAQFAVLGMNSVTIKHFPYFRDESKKHHGYLGILLLVVTAGSLLVVVFNFFFYDYIVQNAHEGSSLLVKYFFYAVPLILFTVLFNVLDTYYRSLYNAVKGIVYKEVVQRVVIIIAVILYYFGLIDFQLLVMLYVFAFIIPSLMLLFSLIRDKQFFLNPDWGFIDKKMIRTMGGIAFFGLVSGYSGVLILNIDTVMIEHYLGLSQTGIYTIAFFFGTLILIPSRAMSKIASVVIADAWKNNDINLISDIYKKTSVTLGMAGIFIFVGLWVNIDNVFEILGDEYTAGKYVIFFIALANLLEMFMGSASQIIVNSPKYRWLTYLLILYVALIITTNMFFIPRYGITGAALASFISRSVFSFMRVGFLRQKFHLTLFSQKHFLMLVAGGIALYLVNEVPKQENYIVDILIRSSLVSLIYIPLVYFFKISPDLNKQINKMLFLDRK